MLQLPFHHTASKSPVLDVLYFPIIGNQYLISLNFTAPVLVIYFIICNSVDVFYVYIICSCFLYYSEILKIVMPACCLYLNTNTLSFNITIAYLTFPLKFQNSCRSHPQKKLLRTDINFINCKSTELITKKWVHIISTSTINI